MFFSKLSSFQSPIPIRIIHLLVAIRETRFFLLLFILLACQPNKPAVTREMLIQEKLEERLVQLYKSKREQCETAALEEANRVVDSIIIARARANQDAMNPLSKPLKPERPDVFILQDTGNVRPLFSVE